MKKLKAIARIEKDGKPLLVFPDIEANAGNVFSATVNGHTEISIDYYRKSTKPISFDEIEYNLGYTKDELYLVKRLKR